MRKMRIKAYLTTPLLSVVRVLCLSIMQIPGFKENWPGKNKMHLLVCHHTDPQIDPECGLVILHSLQQDFCCLNWKSTD